MEVIGCIDDGEKGGKLRRQASDLALAQKKRRILQICPALFFAILLCFFVERLAETHETRIRIEEQRQTLRQGRHEIVNTSESPMQLPFDSIYRLSVVDQLGNQFSLSKFVGKYTLIVNTACKSEKTEVTFKQLAKLHEKLEPYGFSVIAFPANDFHHEVPNDESIFTFLQNTFPEIMFPIMSLSTLQDNPVFQRLHEHLPNQTVYDDFMKYLVDDQGRGIQLFKNEQLPMDILSGFESLVMNMHPREKNLSESRR